MKELYVYADFDWMETPALVGTLLFQEIRGRESCGFCFEREWLRKYEDITLDPELRPYPNMQYTEQGKDIFGCFSDALPDRWGRNLLRKRELLMAKEEQRRPKHLASSDLLCGIDDHSRMGGFRFKEDPDGIFLNSHSGAYPVPPIASLRELEDYSRRIELSERRKEMPEKRWITRLLNPGSSLGGARPKANVVDSDGHLYVAKFPSINDEYDIGLWEYFTNLMARKVGINTPDAGVIKTGEYHTFISRRFDRNEIGKRIHFASAMTMLGLHDGDNASTGYGYPDIVDFIIRYGAESQETVEELFRRVAFNICVGNSDDHFRNHGFLLSRQGWKLAPAYDINPTLNRAQSLLITPDSDEADLSLLWENAESYFLSQDRASQIIDEVTTGLKDWQERALQIGISKREIEYFNDRWITERPKIKNEKVTMTKRGKKPKTSRSL